MNLINGSHRINISQSVKTNSCPLFDFGDGALVGFVLAEDEFFVLQE
jgi:hypothetical protein